MKRELEIIRKALLTERSKFRLLEYNELQQYLQEVYKKKCNEITEIIKTIDEVLYNG